MKYMTARLVWSINKAGQLFYADRLAPLKLGAGQFPVLSVLYAREGLAQEEIAGYLGIDKAAVAKSVRKLLEEGYIARRGDAEDGRLKRVWLTQKARRARPRILEVEAEWQARLLEGFGEEEARQLEVLLGRMDANSRGPRNLE